MASPCLESNRCSLQVFFLSCSYIAQRIMWFKEILLALSLSLLGLGAAQECEGVVGVLGVTPDQLKKEI